MPRIFALGRWFARWLLVAELAVMGSILAVDAVAVESSKPPQRKVPQLVTEVEGTFEYRLSNGLQVLLVPDASKPTTTVYLTLQVGSRNDRYRKSGMAHLLEHLMFHGTAAYPAPRAEFSRRGLQANASTWYDSTSFFANFATDEDNLFWYLGWLANALAEGRIDRSAIEAELAPLRNEIEIAEGSATTVLRQHTLAMLYVQHAYGRSPYGERNDLEQISPNDLRKFRARYYTPSNATLIITGAFDRDATLNTVAARFGGLQGSPHRVRRTRAFVAASDGERRVMIRGSGGAPAVLVAFHAHPGSTQDFAAARMVGQLITNAPNGPLHKRLVVAGRAAQVFGFSFGLAESGAVFIGLLPGQGQTIETTRESSLAALGEPLDFSANEFERERTHWLAEWQRGFANTERVAAELSGAVARGDWRLYFLEREYVRRLTLTDIRRVAGDLLREDNRVVATYMPEERPRQNPEPQAQDLKALLAEFHGEKTSGSAESFEPTPAKLDAATRRFVLPGGLRATLLPRPTRGRRVEASLTFMLGDEEALRDQTPVAGLLARLIREGGATGLDRAALEAELDRLQANVNIGFFRQNLSVEIRTVRENLPAVVVLVGRLLAEPALPAEVFEQVRARWLADLNQAGKYPPTRLDELIGRHGNPHPAGDVRHVPTVEEEAAAVKAVTLEQVRTFHRRCVAAGAGVFAAVGDIDVEPVRHALTSTWGAKASVTLGSCPVERIPDVRSPAPATSITLRMPGQTSANVEVALQIPLRESDEDAPALRIANRMFGHVGTGRLWRRLREREGLSYGAWSAISWNAYDPVSYWRATATFATKDRPRVERILREELTRAVALGFSADELEAARRGLLNERRLVRSQDNVLVRQLIENERLGRSFADDQLVDDRLNALDLAQVNSVWRRYIDVSRLVWAWSGDVDEP
jgi:zinc protease